MNRVSSIAILEGLADDGITPTITVIDHPRESCVRRGAAIGRMSGLDESPE